MINYLVMDVDGTLTDGKVYIAANGELIKAFNIKDGYGIHNILLSTNVTPVIITGRYSDIVSKRAKELGIVNVYQGVSDKLDILLSITKNLKEVAYIGDDLNDLTCIESVNEAGGITACPADAAVRVKKVVDLVTKHVGGEGAVRDFIDWLIEDGKIRE